MSFRATSVFALTLLAWACNPEARRPQPSSPPVAVAQSATAAAQPSARARSEADAAATEPSDPLGTADLRKAVDAYVAAANAHDLEAQSAAASDACWQKECARFAAQAGKEFRINLLGFSAGENRCAAKLDLQCEGKRKCGRVYLLLERASSELWQVVDVTRDAKRASAWQSPRVDEPASPDFPVNGAAKRSLPNGHALVGTIVQSGVVPNAARVIAGMRSRFRACYRSALREDAKAHGKLTVAIEIDADGNVLEAKVTDRAATLPESVEPCIAAVATRSVFTPPEGSHAQITVPISFAPAGKGK